jgi:hypothetical protein
MRRPLLMWLLALAIGATVNLAVAWGCLFALRMTPRFGIRYHPADASASAWWREHRPDCVVDDLAGFDEQSRLGWRTIHYQSDAGGTLRILESGGMLRSWTSTQPRPLPQSHALRTVAGLPMASLAGEHWFRCEDSVVTLKKSGLILDVFHVSLPHSPLWLGFTVNTVLYGAIALALFFGPSAIRRALRRRQDRCLRCGYPLVGLPQCPECGSLQRPTPRVA